MHCTQTQTKMAASKGDVQAVQQISLACTIAKQALEAIGNLQSNDIRNVAALTAANSASTNSIPASSLGSIARGSIATELARRCPMIPKLQLTWSNSGLTVFCGTKRDEMRNKPVG